MKRGFHARVRIVKVRGRVLPPTVCQTCEGQVINLALVRIRDNEGFEQAFRRFKKACEKSGILSEVKKREHFEKPSVRKKKK